jgi:hypothetical protein
MGKNQSASNLTNIIKQDANGNITFVSGSTTLMSVSSSGAITTTGVISGSNALSASYAINATSASYAATSSYASAFNVAGTLTATTLVVQTINVTQSFSSGSNIFGNNISNTQTFTGSVLISGSSTALNVNNGSLFISSSGNVGIGTTFPASQAAGAITGILDVSAATGGNLVLHRTSGGDTALFSILKASNGTYIDSTGASTATNNAIYFRTNNNNADQTSLTSSLTITSGGNVGIATSSPESFGAFAVRKSVSLNSKNVSVSFSDATNSTFDVRHPSASIVDLSSQNSALTFSTSNSSSDGIERMRITSTGNVSIGLITSANKLAVYGGSNAGTVGVMLDGGGTPHLQLYSLTNEAGIGTNSYTSKPLTFKINMTYDVVNSGTEAMRITSIGDICAMRNVLGVSGGTSYKNLSFGAATLMARDAYDSYFCGNLYYDGSWRLKYGSTYGNCVNWYGGEYSFQTSTTNGSADSAVGLTATLFLDRAGNAVFKGSVTQNGSPSDINLKENLVKIASPLEKISQINGYNFDWKEGTAANGLAIPVAEGMQAPESPLSIAHDAGLIAQEVEAIMPQLVRDNGHKALNYNGIIALLVEGIKELKAENDTLKEILQRNNIQ